MYGCVEYAEGGHDGMSRVDKLYASGWDRPHDLGPKPPKTTILNPKPYTLKSGFRVSVAS